METKVITIKKENKVFEYKQAFLFDWELENEKEEGEKIIATFKRDENTSYHSELVKLEQSFLKTTNIPVWVLLIFALLTISLITCYLVLVAINKVISNTQGIILFMAPSGLFGLLLGIFGILRTKQIVNYMNSYETNYKKIKLEIDALKGEQNEAK